MFGALVAVILMGVLAVALFVDPNAYKSRIAAGVRSATGRELTLTGDIKLSWFPWLALELGPATLGNPAGFGKEPFATLRHASLRVRVMPLLHKQLEIGRAEIDGLDLRLRKDARGKGNWEDWGESSSPASQVNEDGDAVLELAGVTLRDSRVSLDDLVADHVEVKVGRVAKGVAIPVQLAMVMKTAADGQPMPIEGEFQTSIDLDAQRYRLAVVQLAGKVPVEGAPAPVSWQFAAPVVDLDLATQTLARATFDASFGAAKVAGTVSGTRIIDAPVLNGGFQLQPVSPRELLPQFGVALPATRDSKVLSALSASGNFRYADDALVTEELKAKLDDTGLSGRFGWTLATSAMNFDLALDRIDADRYLPPPTTASSSAKTEPFELPVDTLKPLTARGQLTVADAKFAGIRLSALRVGIDAHDGQARLAPAQARLYGGQYSGEVNVDTRPATPRVTMQQTLTGVDIAPLMNDLAQSRRLSGRGNVAMNLTAQGRNSDGLTKTLRGKVTANLTGGALEGADIWYAIAQAQSLVQKHTLADNQNRKRTPFDSFRVSADINDGVATSNDLDISSQQLRVTGKGSSNLVSKAIDYQVTATVLKAPPEADSNLTALTLAAIPVNITGTYDDPKVRPDLAGLARARLQKEVDKRKDEVKDKLRDRLKGLLGR